LGIYNENYRRTGVEYQMTFMVKSLQRESAPTIAIALDRGRREADFSEHDRFMLNLLRPHVMTAYANAETVGALRRTAPPPAPAATAAHQRAAVDRPSPAPAARRLLVRPLLRQRRGRRGRSARRARGLATSAGGAGGTGRGARRASRAPRGRGRRHAAHRAVD